MQTFLPYPDFAASARVLDQRRLGKQRVEALQVLRGLIVPGYGWRHHPAVKMWVGCEEALVRYGLEMCDAWTSRGHADTVAATMLAERGPARTQPELAEARALPAWLGRADVHRSHRAALVRKDPDFYAALFPDADPDDPYVWPAA
ncbi:MSMEG_6728 family protein [Dactylosporangium matsuzakiense]|uniref:Cytoplasmic protein n=1 Tax=Dactylosporangium matsuzakiense TaxID=53360 RepID=A0A9W6KXN8_9ACTN|nr:MSMEG_6728 family protein [Dactylosporangium matsuzakiense]UWZ41060.1 MSMEG_6728 family protein [Dactylosporangium matsuzakiense]GLL08315.1 hypothetical protein GCM10017581_100760 [Dactylosporangium matsuzakiense]